MKKGWEIKKLGEVCDKGSSNVSQNQLANDNGKYPIFGASGFIKDVSFYHIEKPYISIVKDGSGVGRITKMDAYTSVIGTLQYIFPKDGIELDYLYYSLLTINFKKYIAGAAIPHIYFKDYQNEPFLYVPLLEQKRIVAILDKCFSAIDKAKANTEQNYKNAKELFESYLQKMFVGNSVLSHAEAQRHGGKNFKPRTTRTNMNGWDEKRFKDIFKIKPPKKEAKDKLAENDFVTFLPMEDLGFKDKIIQPTQIRKLKEVAGSYTYFAENDVLLAKITPCFENGKLGIAKNLTNGIGFGSSEYIVFRSNGIVEPSFLFYFLSRECFRKEGRKYMSGAVGHKRISKDWIDNYTISFPKSLKEQQAIVRQLDALRAESQKLEAVYQKKIVDLEETKKSVLQKAFAGELFSPGSAIISTTKVISFQKIKGISPTDLQAGITAIALQRHIEKDKYDFFGHVKAEKIVHLVENILNIDLERNPIKDAAGPNDYPHAKKVESRARMASFYYVNKKGNRYNYKQGNSISKIVEKTKSVLDEKSNTLFEIIDIIVPMDTQQAEIVATLYAAWNNLILFGNNFSDEDIVTEARENWHEEKLKISRKRFSDAVLWMKKHQLLIPKGNGKVVDKPSLKNQKIKEQP